MSSGSRLPNIFFSPQENALIINKEPDANRQYNVPILNNGITKTSNITLKLKADKLELDRGNGNKQSLKRSADVAQLDNDIGKYIVEWLHKKCPDLDFLDTNDKKEVVVKGYVQSGKTSFMLCSALKFMFGSESMSSIIVLRNATGDQTQIDLRLSNLKRDMSSYMSSKDTSSVIDFTVLDGRANIGDISAAMSGVNPQIFVVLGNDSRIRRLNNMIRKIKSPKFALFIDEADSNDTGISKRTGEIGFLKEASKFLFYISATILDIGLREDEKVSESLENMDEIKEEPEITIPSNVYMLKDVPHYMGLDKLIHRTLPEPALPCNKNEDIPFSRDPNLRDFIDKFSRFEPHDVKMLGLKHPQHCLISSGTVIIPQKSIFKYVTETTDCAVILYNGEGIDLFHHSLVGNKIIIPLSDGCRVVGGKKCEWCEGAHTFNKHIGISEMIQYLKDNGGVEKFPRIITISGKLAGRGISFISSDYGRYLQSFSKPGMPNMIGWRLTSMYYVPSPMTTQPNLMQAIGRVCCVVRDNIPTHIYLNEEVFFDLRKAYWTQEELVIRARAIQGEASDMDIGEAIRQVRMNKSKLSKRRLTISGLKRVPVENMVEWFENDGGFDMNTTYNNESIPDVWEYKATREVVPRTEVTELSMDPVEFERLTTKMFPLWSKSGTNISSFMSNIDPNKLYTTAELKEHCLHNSIRISDIIVDVTGKSHKYGNIMKRVSGGYKMYEELVGIYEKFF
jgi:hypothetical protein